MRYYYSYETAVGQICLAEEDGEISHLLFLTPPEAQKLTADERVARMVIGDMSEEKETALLQRAFQQLKEYLEGQRRTFDLPLKPQGTEFQKKVWNALAEIPYGEIRSYGQIAERCGNPKGCRAVGMANNRNPISIFIPCHRVIGANGKLVGYGGGLAVKEQLLRLEGVLPESMQETRNTEKK